MTSLQFDKVNGPAHFPTIDKREWLVVEKTTIENPISTQRSTPAANANAFLQTALSDLLRSISVSCALLIPAEPL
jgi:hypothetical protein